MADWLSMVVLSLLAGAAMPLGALLARFDLHRPAVLGSLGRHFIAAFGGGALISAVALVLVPEGIKTLSVWAASFWFAAGGIFFCGLNALITRAQGSAGQLVAMLSDFVPEAIALGAAFAAGGSAGMLLALMMVLQNLPEGFSAFEELSEHTDLQPSMILAAFFAMSLLGPVAAMAGYSLLGDRPDTVGALMLFAGAGILFLIFEDVAPQAKDQSRGLPTLGAVAGFLLGIIGHMLISTT